MASSLKDPHNPRSTSQHRPMSSTTPLNVPGRNSGSRNHAHSISLGTLNSTHRVTRRKSMTSNNFAAVAMAVQGIDDASLEALVSADSRNHSIKPGNGVRRVEAASTVKHGVSNFHEDPELNGPGPNDGTPKGNLDLHAQSAVIDDNLTDVPAHSLKSRNHRASDGAYLTKSDGKRVSGELRCEKCGKGYKHSSCLTKHLWEHTPEWSYTSKLLISKHQQVQLLEAASVLVTMNQDPIAGEMGKASDSDHSSASPAASGSSDIQDDDSSSIETTPPPLSDHATDIRDSKRYSSNSSVFSRSYQSLPGTSIAASSVPTSSYGSYHQQGYARRPSTSGSAYNGLPFEDEAGLAAAVELCNFGTPRTGPIQLDEIPPVPPLPARYASHNATRSIGGTAYPMYQPDLVPPPLTHRISDEREVKMQTASISHADDDDDYFNRRSVSRSRSDEYDDGVFGHMEE